LPGSEVVKFIRIHLHVCCIFIQCVIVIVDHSFFHLIVSFLN
jgi:hypothetical protein